MGSQNNSGCPFCGKQHDPGTLVCPMTGLSLRFSDPDRAVGQVIGGKYRLSRLIGRGGMGTVFEAVNVQLDKRVAIKILLPESAHIEQVTERFKREARSAASIGHENIVDVYDLDTTEDGVVYIVMELLAGCDLADVLKNDRCINVERACTLGLQAARALGAAHERGIIHRDMKPENIFLTRKQSGEVVKIVDFGIAMIKEHGSLSRLTTDGILLGTPYYMSPEQARGSKELDHRVDIYALGAVLFEALTGNVLFSGETYLEVISKHQIQPPPLLQERKPDLQVPGGVENVIMKMLEKDPARRPPTMAEVEQALLPYSAERSAASQPAVDSRSDEFAATMADTGRLEARDASQPDRLHTTPVQWEDAEPGRKLVRPRTIMIILGIVLIFVASALIAMTALNRGSKNQESTKVAYPISSVPIGKKTGAKAPKKIELSVEVSPAEAVIRLNGRALDGNPVKLELDASSEPANLTAEAKGYVTKEETLKLDRNHSLALTLEKEAAKTKAPADKPKDKGGEPGDSETKTKSKKGKGSITVTEESPYKK
jgi:serine/threonine protein kinase